MRGRDRELKRHQRSVRVFMEMTSQKPPKTYGDTHYSRMLVEDVANGLVPYRMRGEEFSFSMDPASEEVESIVASGLGRDGYGRRDLLDGVRDFLRDAVQTMMAFEEAPYEIILLSEGDADKRVGFDLSFIAPWTLKRHGSGWVQTIPKEHAERWQMATRIELPSDSVARLQLPPSIKSYFRRMMNDLDLLGRDLYPAFGFPGPGSEAQDIGFDFQAWNKSHGIALAQATRECGWNARGLLSKNVTEYYYVRRFLDFERFKLELRTSILSQLNGVLQIIGKRIGFGGRIVAVGLPDSAQIANSYRDLEAGNVPFSEIKEPYLGS
jgi:hypothetical protein